MASQGCRQRANKDIRSLYSIIDSHLSVTLWTAVAFFQNFTEFLLGFASEQQLVGVLYGYGDLCYVCCFGQVSSINYVHYSGSSSSVTYMTWEAG